MNKLLLIVLPTFLSILFAAPAPADCCEDEFDWAEPHAEALRNHGLTDVLMTSE